MNLRNRLVEWSESGDGWNSGGIDFVPAVWFMRPFWRAVDRRWPGCRVYWGSHGCRKRTPHFGPHECDCCRCPDHAKSNIDEEGVRCVAKPPYYGPDTKFYGEDAPT